MICVYYMKDSKGKKYYGCISKSCAFGRRDRDCVYGSVRELVLSFWNFYFDSKGVKSLITYNNPIDPLSFNGFNTDWLFSSKKVTDFDDKIDSLPPINVLPPEFRESEAYKTGVLPAWKTLSKSENKYWREFKTVKKNNIQKFLKK